MISRLLADAPAVGKAVRSRTVLLNGRRLETWLPSTAALLRNTHRTHTTSSVASAGTNATAAAAEVVSSSQPALAFAYREAQQRFFSRSGVSNPSRLRPLSAMSGARLVSRAFSTKNSYSGPYTVGSRPFAVPHRQSAFQHYRTRRGNLIARRGIAATAAPRFVMHALRLPMGALTASLAGLSYAQYKVTG